MTSEEVDQTAKGGHAPAGGRPIRDGGVVTIVGTGT